ncbi:putative bifunctional diguanylate cyclase/phosphodiesterase [Acidihalobacter prosperus]|nr:EAL domain-containing protein [Acidihalobacter prosperus]
MPQHTAKILAVDDEPRLLDSLQQLLALHGYAITTANDGRAAIEQLRTDSFDIALIDLKMPDVNGQRIMRYVAENNIRTDIIVISGEASFETAVEAIRLGAHDFLLKPYAPEQLIKRIENTIERRKLKSDAVDIQERLKNSEKLHRFLVNTSPDIIYVLNEEGHFTFVNQRVHQLLGFTREELIGKHYTTLVHEDDLELAQYAFNERRTGTRATHNLELRLRTKDREGHSHKSFATSVMCVELNATGLYANTSGAHDNARRHLGTYGVARDISSRKQAEAIIRYQAYHDLLTGLPNRTLFKDRLNMVIAQARRVGQMVAVMFIDLDRFKIVNDTLGHVIGDQLLRAVGRRIQTCLREGDTLARLGGDEFVVLLPQLTHRESAATVGRKIIESLTPPFLIDQHELFVGASIGISLFPSDGNSDEELIKNADIAMYSVKNDTRGGYSFYTARMESTFSQHLDLEMGLRRALTNHEFAIHYQPQFDAQGQTVCGVEALLRWQHPERGLLYPGDFIPLAEEVGLIGHMTEWVIDTTVRQMKAWVDAGIAPPRMAINLSALDLKRSSLVGEITQALERHQLPGERIELEITENLIVQDINIATQRLTELARHGISIAIDDFGTGYSSLSYLHQLPIHTLKIDRSFVQDIVPERTGRSVIDAIIAMGHSLELTIVAEGVETELQKDWLAQKRCHGMQGYLFSRPLPTEAVTHLLEAAISRNVDVTVQAESR